MSPAYEKVLHAAEALTPDERQQLIAALQRPPTARPRTKAEWQAVFEANIIHLPVLQDFSNRREDWYGDDGR